jgi:prepilin-type N-terminal cleavage/methylation domain-containing protein
MKLQITNNRQLITCLPAGKAKRKAFTLVEILIAASIFATVMVIATGILGQSTSFRSKIKATRETSDDVKKISDMITRDVMNAKETGQPSSYSYNDHILIIPKILYFPRGIIMGNSTVAIRQPLFSLLPTPVYPAETYPSPPAGNFANFLIIAMNDRYHIYYNINGKACYTDMQRTPFSGVTISVSESYVDPATAGCAQQLNSGNTDVILNFAGFSPQTSFVNQQQPYVQFYIQSKTKNYSTSSPNSRAMTEIRSSVTPRSLPN